MRHADVCRCRDCQVAVLATLMEGMADPEGRVAMAVVGLGIGTSTMRVDEVALPYEEVLVAVQRMELVLANMRDIVQPDGPVPGPFAEQAERMERELRVLRTAWRRD